MIATDHLQLDFCDDGFPFRDQAGTIPQIGEERPEVGGHPARESRAILLLESAPLSARVVQLRHLALAGGGSPLAQRTVCEHNDAAIRDARGFGPCLRDRW